jgi:hypothetical protein
MTTRDDAWIGVAGEFLAASVLQRRFKTIATASSSSPYDLILENYSGVFYKCQVKSTWYVQEVNKKFYWQWHPSRHNKKSYESKDVDFFAFVALPIRAVFFAVTHDVTNSVFRIRKDALDVVVEQESLEKVIKNIHE